MELYAETSYRLARQLTEDYSTSFSLSSRFFDTSIRADIYALYGMVRIADEIVDTYKGADAIHLLDEFEREILVQLKKDVPFSTNPIIHAFTLTAKKYGIDQTLIAPFFASMHSDINKKTYSKQEFDNYIYGSAEVVGLMCLKIFTGNDVAAYDQLSPSARALSRAYQKVNFLRDIADDHSTRGRFYFPVGSFESLNDSQKKQIEQDIASDFVAAKNGIANLPPNAKKAVALSYAYYFALFEKFVAASTEELKTKRVRLPSLRKTQILAKHLLKNGAA